MHKRLEILNSFLLSVMNAKSQTAAQKSNTATTAIYFCSLYISFLRKSKMLLSSLTGASNLQLTKPRTTIITVCSISSHIIDVKCHWEAMLEQLLPTGTLQNDKITFKTMNNVSKPEKMIFALQFYQECLQFSVLVLAPLKREDSCEQGAIHYCSHLNLNCKAHQIATYSKCHKSDN